MHDQNPASVKVPACFCIASAQHGPYDLRSIDQTLAGNSGGGSQKRFGPHGAPKFGGRAAENRDAQWLGSGEEEAGALPGRLGPHPASWRWMTRWTVARPMPVPANSLMPCSRWKGQEQLGGEAHVEAGAVVGDAIDDLPSRISAWNGSAPSRRLRTSRRCAAGSPGPRGSAPGRRRRRGRARRGSRCAGPGSSWRSSVRICSTIWLRLTSSRFMVWRVRRARSIRSSMRRAMRWVAMRMRWRYSRPVSSRRGA